MLKPDNFNFEAACDDGRNAPRRRTNQVQAVVISEQSGVGNQIVTSIVANPSDIILDGCVQLNDLLDLLSAYGDCGAEEEASGFALSFDGVNDHVDFGNASLGNVEDVTFEVLMKTGSDSEGINQLSGLVE